MKAINLLTLGIVSLAISLPMAASNQAVQAAPRSNHLLVAQAAKAAIKLQLNLLKRVETRDAQGKTKVTWKPIPDNSILPGMVLRYQVIGKNLGKGTAQNLKVTQPVPDTMVYQLQSAKPIDGTQVLFSIDKGKTFVASPTVRVLEFANGLPRFVEKPAPADRYTHVQWQFNRGVKGGESFQVTYDVTVK